jgi:hypothetical protein
MRGENFGQQTFTSKVDGNKQPLLSAIEQAKGRGVDFSKQTFQSHLDGENSGFTTKESQARTSGNAFDRSTFTGTINANGNALTVAQSVWDTVRNFAGKVFTATLETITKGGKSADGSIYNGDGTWNQRFQPKYFANGGIENHVAQIARPSSTLRVWAEPETGGEAYIPLAASKRARSVQILDEVADRFGYSLTKNMQAFSNGGISGGSEASGGGVHVHVDAAPGVAYQYANEVARATATRFRDAQVLYDVA